MKTHLLARVRAVVVVELAAEEAAEVLAVEDCYEQNEREKGEEVRRQPRPAEEGGRRRRRRLHFS